MASKATITAVAATIVAATKDGSSLTADVKQRLEANVGKAELTKRRNLGLTDDDVMWNVRFGRPLHWLETVDPATEQRRRAEWLVKYQPMLDADAKAAADGSQKGGI